MYDPRGANANVLKMKPEMLRALVSGIAFGHDGKGTELKALQKAHRRWWDHKNVLGLCVTPKIQGHQLRELALQVFVKKKQPLHLLQDVHRVPGSIDFEHEGSAHQIPTDVREIGQARLETLVSVDRPARPGFNVGNELSGSGTLTCAVTRRSSQQRLGLSCGHVIARYGRATAGERVWIPSKQEADSVGISESDADFGALVDIGPISANFDDAPSNLDAATFAPDDPEALDNLVALLGIRPTAIRDNVPVHLPVRKVGYMSSVTHGAVVATQVVVSFPFPFDGGAKKVWFSDQIGLTRLSSDGDSGALVLDAAGAAIGIHIGSFNDMSICTPIRHVLDAFDCDLSAT
jgi:hypothetical protein